MSDDGIAGLTPSEQAYFDGKGDVAPPEAPAEPAQPQEAKPAPEAVEAADAPQETPQEAKTVPLGALHEERNKRKEAERAMRTLREEMQRISGQLDVLKGVAPQAQPAPKPTVADAPIEALEQVVQYVEQDRAERQNVAQYHEFTNAVNAAEREFAAKTPDFQAAVDFLHQGRLAEMKAIGYPDQAYIDPATGQRIPSAAEIIAQEAIGISSTAFQQGVNPAERFYALARARGYSAKAAETTEPSDGAKTAAALEKAADKLATIAKGQQASKSLSSAGGASNDALTLEAIASMDEEEFAKISDKVWKRMWTQ
jgi:hypothetical protein